MRKSPEENRIDETKAFWLLVATVSVAFAWILWPYFGAVFWAGALAVMFTPMYRGLRRRSKRGATEVAIATLVIILIVVILPLTLLTALLVEEGTQFYARMKSGEIDFRVHFEQMLGVLPAWVTGALERFGLTDLAAVHERLSAGLMRSAQFLSSQALSIGQNTLELIVSFFIMLYLLFFFLRDGSELSRRISQAVPLERNLQHELAVKFAQVIRATVKGNVVVAIVQGALGGLIFWILDVRGALLWAVLMALFSLLPAVGAGLIWLPVAAYFLVTGAMWQGIALIVYGVLVIGLADNFLRPVLVGKDTKMPDYVILVSTLGGLAIFGLSGFVIGPVIAAMFIAVWQTVAQQRSRGTL